MIAARATALALALAVLVGCDRPAPVRDCGDDLGGVWRGPDGRWQAIDRRRAIELYPIDREPTAALPPGVVSAPSVIDLTRAGLTLAGSISRRYERGASFCKVATPIAAITCGAGRLTLTIAPPPPPADWSTCEAPPTSSTIVVLERR